MERARVGYGARRWARAGVAPAARARTARARWRGRWHDRAPVGRRTPVRGTARHSVAGRTPGPQRLAVNCGARTVHARDAPTLPGWAIGRSGGASAQRAPARRDLDARVPASWRDEQRPWYRSICRTAGALGAPARARGRRVVQHASMRPRAGEPSRPPPPHVGAGATSSGAHAAPALAIAKRRASEHEAVSVPGAAPPRGARARRRRAGRAPRLDEAQVLDDGARPAGAGRRSSCVSAGLCSRPADNASARPSSYAVDGLGGRLTSGML
jgi:hypothetical protein